MGTIQGAINKTIATAGVVSSILTAKQKLAQKNLEDTKLARATQRAKMEKQRALYQKAKLTKLKAQQGIKDLKQKPSEKITIGGKEVKDPKLLERLKGVK